MPERIARTVIHNRTNKLRLVKTFDHLCGGEWTPGGWTPPAVIEPGATGGMQSESDGVLTGTEGYAKYDVFDGSSRLGMVYVYWNNPWFGVTRPRFATDASDVFPDCDFEAPDGSGSTFVIKTDLRFHLAPVAYKHTQGGGDVTAPGDLLQAFAAGPIGGIVTLFGLAGITKDPQWEYELRDDMFAFVSSGLTATGGHRAQGFPFVLPHGENEVVQGAWRYCDKCHGMFFDGYPEKGACPTGGGHNAQGWEFLLPHDVPETGNAQAAWRYCDKCHGMFFDGYPEKGACPTGGGHNAQGYTFVLPHDMAETPNAQAAWRYCEKCHGMFFDGYPEKGHCPA